MNRISIIFASLVILLGFSSIAASLVTFHSAKPLQFLVFLVLASVASGLRLALPSRSGTLSINFLFCLVGLVELTQPETTVLTVVCTYIQCLHIPPRKPRFLQFLFNIANIG